MGTLVIQPLKVHSLRGLTSIPMAGDDYKEAAGQTFKEGAFVEIDAAGAVIEAGVGASLKPAFGIAANDATGVTGTKVDIVIIQPGVLIEATLEGSGAGVNHALAQTNLHEQYGIVKNGNNFHLDIDDTTNKCGIIVGFVSAIGDIRPRVIFEIVPAYSYLI